MDSKSPLLSQELLGELERQWRVQGAPVLDHLRPGLADDEIDERIGPLDLRLPWEPRTWWRWHDGATSDAGVPGARTIGAGFEFLPLSEAVDQYRLCREAAREVASTPGQDPQMSEPGYWWAPEWFPITLTGYGGVVACDCSVADDAPSPIRMVWWAGREDFPEPVTGSFGQTVAWWIDALATGVWRYDAGDGGWQVDHALLDDPDRQLSRLV